MRGYVDAWCHSFIYDYHLIRAFIMRFHGSYNMIKQYVCIKWALAIM